MYLTSAVFRRRVVADKLRPTTPLSGATAWILDFALGMLATREAIKRLHYAFVFKNAEEEK